MTVAINSLELIVMRRFFSILVLPLIAAFLLTACGGSSSDSEGTATPEIVLNLPAEFSTGETGRAVPDYVTGIFLTVTGDGMEDIELSIDPDNLSASVTVTFGTRTFSIVITTSIGKTFTGWKTVEVTSGSTRIIEIDLVVNDPPKVTLKASNGAPVIGQAVALSATATDADGDPMTYSWSKNGGALSASGLSGKWHSPVSGSYKVTFTASDGRGGVGTASVTLSISGVNGAPVVNSVTVSNPNPVVGEAITLTCNATDPDGDPLTYWFSDGIAWGSAANPATWTLTASGAKTITCTATDPGGLTGVGSVGFTVNPGAPLLTAVMGAIAGTIDLSWTADPATIHTEIYYNLVTGVTFADLLVTATPALTTTYNCAPPGGPGDIHYFVSYPWVLPGVLGSPSNEASALCPPPNAPTGLTADTSVLGQITFNWNAAPGATSYNFSFSTRPACSVPTGGGGATVPQTSAVVTCAPSDCVDFTVGSVAGPFSSVTNATLNGVPCPVGVLF